MNNFDNRFRYQLPEGHENISRALAEVGLFFPFVFGGLYSVVSGGVVVSMTPYSSAGCPRHSIDAYKDLAKEITEHTRKWKTPITATVIEENRFALLEEASRGEQTSVDKREECKPAVGAVESTDTSSTRKESGDAGAGTGAEGKAPRKRAGRKPKIVDV